MLKILFPPLHKEGHRFVFIFAAVTLITFFIHSYLFLLCTGLTIWCFYFFRDPQRQVPQIDNIAISPADGVVCLLDEAAPPPELGMGDEKLKRVCTFMNVFNCHVNRVPVAGEIIQSAYHKGQFLNASLDKASSKNERNSIVIQTPEGEKYCVVQIAGLVARRIVCEVEPKDRLEAGERFGIIRFGSRVDVYLPEGMTPTVSVGQNMVAGETIIAQKTDITFKTKKI